MAGLLLRVPLALGTALAVAGSAAATGVLAGALTCALTGAPESAPQKGQISSRFPAAYRTATKSCIFTPRKCVRSALIGPIRRVACMYVISSSSP